MSSKWSISLTWASKCTNSGFFSILQPEHWNVITFRQYSRCWMMRRCYMITLPPQHHERGNLTLKNRRDVPVWPCVQIPPFWCYLLFLSWFSNRFDSKSHFVHQTDTKWAGNRDAGLEVLIGDILWFLFAL